LHQFCTENAPNFIPAFLILFADKIHTNISLCQHKPALEVCSYVRVDCWLEYQKGETVITVLFLHFSINSFQLSMAIPDVMGPSGDPEPLRFWAARFSSADKFLILLENWKINEVDI